MNDSPILEVREITKRFPGVLALNCVNLRLQKGEVLAVIGENGAGKSTLMKILAGVQPPDAGEILLHGQPVVIDSVPKATNLGIALIHQELNLNDNLDVGANVFLGREPVWGGPLQLIDRKQIESKTAAILKRLGMNCSPRTIVSRLSIAQQQMVEIVKALSVNAQILIMDEPTSSLTQHETAQLFHVIKDLKAQGVSIVYISHRLGEVKEVADRVLALRDGKNAGELPHDQINHDNMVNMMVGRDIVQFYQHTEHKTKEAILQVKDLATSQNPDHKINFTLYRGEITGFAGLVGAGRTELAEVLFGIRQPKSGEIILNDKPIRLKSPADAIRAGIALVPEDRKQQGLIVELSVRSNIVLAGLNHHQTASIVHFKEEKAVAKRMVKELNVKTPSIEQIAQFLSGGNQQKVVLAKWLSLQPRILILDEPTRGLDVGAKTEIYKLMDELASNGVAIMMISSEMQEILGMSDRVLVMHEGRLAGELQRHQLSEEAIMQLATGVME